MPQILHRLVLPSFRSALSQHLPVLAIRSGNPGPCVAVTANIHGDEATGVGVIHQLMGVLEQDLLRGEVFLYPSLNLPGLVQATRTLPADGQDLNRLFPGDARGTASERHAHAIWSDLASRGIQLLIDLHADAPAAIPYALADRVCRGKPGDAALERRVHALAAATGLTVLREYPREQYLRYHLDRSLSGAAVNVMGVPAVTIEAGPRRYLDPTAVDIALNAVLGVLAAEEMVAEPHAAHPSRLEGGPWRRQPGPRASVSGIFHALIRPGEPFTVGDLLAEVRSLEGRPLEQLRAESEGYVISLPERAWMIAGVSAGTYATRDG
ncbi:MAG: succinylglutamate desuccinylase/aspartoacylase family protein [Alphaproteobacteria bacterium]|nr:succinylglutamate desuccinylase/aspartoacylase family protein [Alphaproteobacteria bacterium]